MNVLKSRIIGEEAQATLSPINGLTVTAAATHFDTAIQGNFSNCNLLGQQQNFTGNPFPYIPNWPLVFEGEYRHAIAGGTTALFGANANYRTATTADIGNGALLAIGGYYLLDLRLGVEGPDGRWRAQLYGRNVTDQYDWTNVARVADNLRRYAGMPATGGVQVKFEY